MRKLALGEEVFSVASGCNSHGMKERRPVPAAFDAQLWSGDRAELFTTASGNSIELIEYVPPPEAPLPLGCFDVESGKVLDYSLMTFGEALTAASYGCFDKSWQRRVREEKEKRRIEVAQSSKEVFT